MYVDSLASPRDNPAGGKDDNASPAIGGRYAGGALTPLAREHEPLKRAAGVTVASDKTERLVAAVVSEEFGLRQVFLSGIAQARSARQAARIDVAGITGFGGAIAAQPVFLMPLLRLGCGSG